MSGFFCAPITWVCLGLALTAWGVVDVEHPAPADLGLAGIGTGLALALLTAPSGVTVAVTFLGCAFGVTAIRHALSSLSLSSSRFTPIH